MKAYGLALGLVAAPIARGFKGVVALPVSDAPVRHVYAIWSNSPSPAAKAFLQVLERCLDARANNY